MNQTRFKTNISRLLQRVVKSFGLRITRDMVALGRSRRFSLDDRVEFVRLSSLELVAQEIYDRGVAGQVAELGVYRGDFAKLLNEAFPDRRLYLFDTFEGFNATDVTIEKTKSFSTGTQDFSNTNVELVLSKMPHPTRCVVRKGYFPDTATGLEETFAFVSIDADLYEPILRGLEYFYPRIVPGGYIFVHDYNDALYPGAKQAVREFCAREHLNFFPLSDGWGTAVLCK